MDPHQAATAVMSIPRDLKVLIPGYGINKINAAYSLGGPNLTAKTIKSLFGDDFKINHIVNVNFSGFREVVDALGCVYADVDRRYYHSNLGLPVSQHYAEIDIKPGYQQLCGQRALDYVRFRHADSDLVRAARQQDFLRAAKDQLEHASLIDQRDQADQDHAEDHADRREPALGQGLLKLPSSRSSPPTTRSPRSSSRRSTPATPRPASTSRPREATLQRLRNQFFHGAPEAKSSSSKTTVQEGGQGAKSGNARISERQGRLRAHGGRRTSSRGRSQPPPRLPALLPGAS